jgi:hypothetical protein
MVSCCLPNTRPVKRGGEACLREDGRDVGEHGATSAFFMIDAKADQAMNAVHVVHVLLSGGEQVPGSSCLRYRYDQPLPAQPRAASVFRTH